MSPDRDRPIRIANCSGFYGDRIAAAREMVEGGPIDVLTGDYLAELTMLILAKAQAKDPARGYATTFLTQMEQVLGTCLERGIRIVGQRGRAQPRRPRRAVRRARRSGSGCAAQVAHVEGDDLRGDLAAITPPVAARPVSANAYLGGWGIAEALGAGADVVVDRAGHRRVARRRAGGVVARLGGAATGTRSPARWWPGTSSSAARRPPAATTRSSTRSPTAATRGSRSPRSPPTARR